MHASTSIARLREQGWNRLYPQGTLRITVSMGTCGVAAGAREVFKTLEQSMKNGTLPVELAQTGCAGMCWAEPLVSFHLPGRPRAYYGSVSVESVQALLASVLKGTYPAQGCLGLVYQDHMDDWGADIELCEEAANPLSDTQEVRKTVDEKRVSSPSNDGEMMPSFSISSDGEMVSSFSTRSDAEMVSNFSNSSDDEAHMLLFDHPFLRKQCRRIMNSWGLISPHSVEEYAAIGGYRALDEVLHTLSPEQLIALVCESGLRGRGGAGYPTGDKWLKVASAEDTTRYVIANADEGDPGAYMDRGLMESNPHRLIEGMLLAAYATGAHEGYIFTRSEYPMALELMQQALDEAEQAGLLGTAILGTDFNFTIRIVTSPGGYICGEETALIACLENKRPDPVKRPPYPTEKGLYDHPTCVNNVETLANIPFIAARGVSAFTSCGTDLTPGTKLFSLAGSIERPGLIEVPFGMCMTEVVEEIAGMKAVSLRNVVHDEAGLETVVQVGGPSGALLPLKSEGLILDFEPLQQKGAILGSGGIVVLGSLTCVVDTVRYFLHFSAKESCGQCAACREGLCEASAIMDAICEGCAEVSAIETLKQLTQSIRSGSRCALGKMAVTPLESSLRHFEGRFLEHIRGTCYGLTCKELMHFEVIAEACPGCLCCLNTCPTGAIKGRYGKPFEIVQDKCIKCWMCVARCPYPALKAFPEPACEAAAVTLCDDTAVSTSARSDDTALSKNAHGYDRAISEVPCGDDEASPDSTFGDVFAGTDVILDEKTATPVVSLDDDAALREFVLTQREDEAAWPDGLPGCILCGLCVEQCRAAGPSALCFVGNGSKRRLIKPLYQGKSSCTECGACYELCPTNALDALDYLEVAPLTGACTVKNS